MNTDTINRNIEIIYEELKELNKKLNFIGTMTMVCVIFLFFIARVLLIKSDLGFWELLTG